MIARREKQTGMACLSLVKSDRILLGRKNYMKSETYQKLSEKFRRFLLSFICIAAFLFFFVAVLANSLNTNLNHFLFG